MAVGFVLVRCRPGTERGVFQGLMGVDGMVEVFPLFGEYDFIVKMEAADFDALGVRIVEGIRSIPGVESTETLTATAL